HIENGDAPAFPYRHSQEPHPAFEPHLIQAHLTPKWRAKRFEALFYFLCHRFAPLPAGADDRRKGGLQAVLPPARRIWILGLEIERQVDLTLTGGLLYKLLKLLEGGHLWMGNDEFANLDHVFFLGTADRAI